MIIRFQAVFGVSLSWHDWEYRLIFRFLEQRPSGSKIRRSFSRFHHNLLSRRRRTSPRRREAGKSGRGEGRGKGWSRCLDRAGLADGICSSRSRVRYGDFVGASEGYISRRSRYAWYCDTAHGGWVTSGSAYTTLKLEDVRITVAIIGSFLTVSLFRILIV